MAELEKIDASSSVLYQKTHETFLALDASQPVKMLLQAKEFSKITPLGNCLD